MSDLPIECPHCHKSFKLNETLAAPLVEQTRRKFQREFQEILYQYLTGPEFRRRIEALKDAFVAMQDDLDAERRVIIKQWEKRQKQIDRVMTSTAGMYGDLQGIAGKTFQEIDGLDLRQLAADQPEKCLTQ